MATYEIEIRTTQQMFDVGPPTSALIANNLELYNNKVGVVIPDDFPVEIPSGKLIEGDTLIIRLVNDMPVPLSTGIHWHGIELQNNADGTPVTQNPVPGGDLQQLGGVGPQVGGTYLYKFKVPREGIFWFHPHHFHSTNRVFRGTYGMIIVDSLLEPGLIGSDTIPDLPQTERVVLSDITVCEAPLPANNQGYDLTLPWAGPGGVLLAQPGHSPQDICDVNAVGEDGMGIGGYLAGQVPNIQRPTGRVNEGITVLTNGQNVGPRGGTPNAPAALVPADVRLIDVQPEQGLRLQFVNCAAARYFRLKLTDNLGNNYDLIRIGGEGGLLDAAVLEGGTITGFDTKYDAGEILIPPASRADVVVAIPDIAGVTDLTLWTLDFEKIPGAGGWARIPTVPVLHLNITGANFVPAYSIVGLTNGAVGSTVLRTGLDVVELLGAATAGVLDPAGFTPIKLGMFDDNIKLTSGTPSIDGIVGSFSGFMPYSDADHVGSTRWALENDLLHLSVENTTSAHHPFHLHGFSFQPVSITDGVNTLTWGYQEFRDNLDVPAGATLNFRVKIENDRRFADDHPSNVGGSNGRWLFHCHIFWHAHRGMISELVIVDNTDGDEKPNIDVNGSWTFAPSGSAASRTGTYFLPDGDILGTIVAHYDTGVPVGDITIISATEWSWLSHTIPALPLPDQTNYIYVTITGGSGRKDQTLFRLQLGGLDNGSDNGDPHIRTIDGTHYDFQSVGEFKLLGDRDGMVVQTRQTPVPTANKITNSYTGLTSCVSVNTAVAARVGSHYISYQPGKADGTLEFFLDGLKTKLTTNTMNLDNNLVRGVLVNGKMSLRVDYEHHAVLIASPRFWSNHNFHYMNISISKTHGDEGLMGKIPSGSWLPRLGNGVTLGPKPVALIDRYVELYQMFADSWRVMDGNSMFTYLPGTNTETFTDKDWPTFDKDCKVKPGLGLPGKIQKPIPIKTAQKICVLVTEKDLFNDCVLDVAATGEKSFADGYLLEQKFRFKATSTQVTFIEGEQETKIELVALVSSLNEKGEFPTGNVTFYINDEPINNPVPVENGQAVIMIDRPTPEDLITAKYTNEEEEKLEESESPAIIIPE